MTGGRIKRIQKHVGDSPFMLTYGDGVAEIDVKSLLSFHEKSRKKCTVTSVQPSGRFGLLVLNEQNGVASFSEKPKGDGA
ncbi:sugar phosphate nucleotidyltransferase, partial [Acinetobacter baumannii]